MSNGDTAPLVRPFWLTRDRMVSGKLSGMVTVWDTRPDRENYYPLGVQWYHDSGYLREITLKSCREAYGASPDTDMECIRVGLLS